MVNSERSIVELTSVLALVYLRSDQLFKLSGSEAELYSSTNLAPVLLSGSANSEIKISVDIKKGIGSWTVWTSDLSFDYVKINALYHN